MKMVRDIIIDNIIRYMKDDPNVIFLTGDLGFGSVDKIQKYFPQRFINCGIAQQNMVAMAAGLALQGWKVYIYSTANFVNLRALQHIRNDVVINNLDVNIICVAGFAFGTLGNSHYGLEDISVLLPYQNFSIYTPCDSKQAQAVIQDSYVNDTPSYIRITTDEEQFEPKCTIGLFRKIISHQFSDKLVLSHGGIVTSCIKKIEGNDQFDIYTINSLRDIDYYFLMKNLNKYRTIFIVQQHSIVNGFGSIMKQKICMINNNIEVINIGVQGININSGGRDYLVDNFINWEDLYNTRREEQ